jgi:hypothetical protein
MSVSKDEALADFAAALEAQKAAQEQAMQKARDARASGATWSEIATAAGLSSASGAEHRYSDAPGVKADKKRSRPSTASAEPLEGESVGEWAKAHGLSRAAVYKRVKAGNITFIVTPSGKIRITE